MPQPTFGDGAAQTPPHIFSLAAHIIGPLEPPPTLVVDPAIPDMAPAPVVPPVPRDGGNPPREPPIPTGEGCPPLPGNAPPPWTPPLAGGGDDSPDPPEAGGVTTGPGSSWKPPVPVAALAPPPAPAPGWPPTVSAASVSDRTTPRDSAVAHDTAGASMVAAMTTTRTRLNLDKRKPPAAKSPRRRDGSQATFPPAARMPAGRVEETCNETRTTRAAYDAHDKANFSVSPCEYEAKFVAVLRSAPP